MATPSYRRLPAAERRELILTSATELIANRGYAGLTMEAFADAAGMTAAGLLHHFSSKEELLLSVIERRDQLDEAAAILFAGGPVHDAAAAREVMDRAMSRFAEQHSLMRLYLILSVEALDPDHPAHGYFQWRQAQARRLIATDLLSWHPDPQTAAVELVAFIDGLGLHWLRDPEIDYVAQWRSFADRFFTAA